jgi:hypothetical protein
VPQNTQSPIQALLFSIELALHNISTLHQMRIATCMVMVLCVCLTKTQNSQAN